MITDNNQDKKTRRRAYVMYILSLLIFGTNGLLVAHISLPSSQIVLFRTLIGCISLIITVRDFP